MKPLEYLYTGVDFQSFQVSTEKCMENLYNATEDVGYMFGDNLTAGPQNFGIALRAILFQFLGLPAVPRLKYMAFHVKM